MYSDNFECHPSHLSEVLCWLRSAGLTVNTDKVTFAKEKISVISHKTVTEDPERIQGIRDFNPPKDGKGKGRFVGMVNFYRRFILKWRKLRPRSVSNEIRGQNLNGMQQRAFEALKKAIISPSVLLMLDFSLFPTACLADGVALEAVLSQELVDGARQPVAFTSQTLTQ